MTSGQDSTDSNELGTSDFAGLNLSDCAGDKPKFKFPAPPRLSVSANNSCYSSQSYESSTNSVNRVLNDSVKKHRKKKTDFARKLPPIGIFWDIENVQVPKMKSATTVVLKIRDVFLKDYRESEFVVVCDVKKEHPRIIEELHDSQVNLIHVSSASKNAADEKLRQSLRRFAELHPAPSAIVLISGDGNFASDLSDLRYRKKIRVILVYNVHHVANALLLCANEHHSIAELTDDLPKNIERKIEDSGTYFFLTISNLPKSFEPARVKNRLHKLTDNCGGKCFEFIAAEGIACLRFGSFDLALRAQKRIQGEDVMGNKIKVLSPSVRSYTGQRIKHSDRSFQHQGINNVPPPPGFNKLPPPPAVPFNFENRQSNAHPFSLPNVDIREFRRNQQENQSVPTPPIMMDSSLFSFTDSVVVGPQQMGSHVMRPSSVSPMDLSYDEQPHGTFNRRMAANRQGTRHEQLMATLGSVAGALPGGGAYGRVHKTSGSSEYSDSEVKGNVTSDFKKSQGSNQSVHLNITNLDPTIDAKELKRLLSNWIKGFVMISSLNVIVQTDGTPIATLRVNSQEEAQFIISQMHRQKFCNRRIVISYAEHDSPGPELLRVMVITVLQDVPDKRMPLFKFMEILESRYYCTVSVSEVNRLKDTVRISDEMGSRMISLTQDASSTHNLSQNMIPYCVIHCPKGFRNIGWCELNTSYIPNVMMPLSVFAPKLISLLNVHFGSLSLLSFEACYEQECGEPLPVTEDGVPLEHLITCVPNVEIKSVGPKKSIKVIIHDIRQMENEDEQVLKSVAPSLAPNVNLLCRELVDLLKTRYKCQLLLSRFIPAYHHHFGRQCRVADYGFTKLLDLFEAIPHVVQVMGLSRKILTLTHSAQMRRFTSDLLRILKLQPNKQVGFDEFPGAYEKVLNRPFNPVEYGLCTFDDLLHEIPENTIVMIKSDEGAAAFISVPKKEQTPDEVFRTRQFANEIKELPDGERTVSLEPQLSLKILGSQVMQVMKNVGGGDSLKLEDLSMLYFREFGYPLNPQLYQCETVAEVMEKLSEYVQIIHSNAGSLLCPIVMDNLPNILRVRCWALLLSPPHVKDIPTFKYEYELCYNNRFSMESLKHISDVVSISSMNKTDFVSLTSLYVLAAQLYYVICNNGGSVVFSHLERFYSDYYNKPLKLQSTFNIDSISTFYNYFNLIFYVRGSKKKNIVVLNRTLQEHLAPLAALKYDNNNTEIGNKVINQWCLSASPTSELVEKAKKKISVPKPETPPTPGYSLWSPPNKSSEYYSSNFSINIPINLNPTLLDNPVCQLFPVDGGNKAWTATPQPVDVAPEPHELPIPEKLLKRTEGVSDDSGDSGVNSRLENSPSDNESSSCEKQGTYKKALYKALLNFK